MKVTAGIHHTMGGLKIDESTHVLTVDGQIIPGLFAAGDERTYDYAVAILLFVLYSALRQE